MKKLLMLAIVISVRGLNADVCNSALQNACGTTDISSENWACCNEGYAFWHTDAVRTDVTAFCPSGLKSASAGPLAVQGHPCLAALKGKKAAFELADNKFRCSGNKGYFPILVGHQLACPGGASRQCANYKWVNAFVNDDGTVNPTVTNKPCGQN